LIPAAHVSASGVALGLVWFTRRDRHAGADRQSHRRVQAGCSRDGLVGAVAGRGEILVCQRGLGIPDALHCRRATTHDIHVLSGGLARLVRGRSIPGGQGGVSQDHVPEYREPPAKLRAALKGRLGRHPGRRRLTPVCQCQALTAEAHHPQHLIVSGLALGSHLAELCGDSGQIAAKRLRHPEVKATRTRVEPVTDRVGEVASLLASCANPEQVTRDESAHRLPGEELAEPPPIVHGTGQADRLGEACPGHLDVIAQAGGKPAGGQCPGSGAGSLTSRAIATACSA
jgi:hypothetical protein